MIGRVESCPGLAEARRAFNDKIRLGTAGAKEYVESHFSTVTGLVDRLEKFAQFRDEQKLSLKEVQHNLRTIREDSKLISTFPSGSKTFGCFTVDSSSLKEDLVSLAKSAYPKAKSVLGKAYRTALSEFWTEVEGIKERLTGEKEDLEAYEELIKTVKRMRPNNMELQNQVALAQGIFADFFAGSEKKAASAKELGGTVDRLVRSIESLNVMFSRKVLQIQSKGDQLIEMLERRLDVLVGSLRALQQKLANEALVRLPSLESAALVLQRVAAAKSALAEQQTAIRSVSNFIELLRDVSLPQLSALKVFKQTDAEHVYAEAEQLIEDTSELWTRIGKYCEAEEIAKKTEFLQLDFAATKAEAIGFRRFVENGRKEMEARFGGQKIFDELVGKAKILEGLVDSTEPMQRLVGFPQVAVMKAAKKLRIAAGEKFTLFDLKEIGEWDELKRRAIDEVCEDFAEETRVVRELAELRTGIERAELTVRPLSQGENMFALTEYEGFFELLESSAVRAETLAARPTSEKYKPEVDRLRKDIQMVQGAAEQLLLAQDKWLQLRRLFECKALREAMAEQARALQEQETVMLGITGNLARSPGAYKFLLQERLGPQLAAVSSGLQKIQKEAEDLLENKKVQIPRLLFLSNTQLIEFFLGVRSQSFTHIQRLFPGVCKLLSRTGKTASVLPGEHVYSDPEPVSSTRRRTNVVKWLTEEKEDMLGRKSEQAATDSTEIEGLVGGDDELIRLVEPVPLGNSEKLGEAVEWVLKFEYQMQQTVSKSIAQAINSFTKASLEEWVLDFPVQVVLTAAHMIITHEMSELLQPESEDEDDQSRDLEEEENAARRHEQKKELPKKVWSPLVLEPESEEQKAQKNREITEMFGSFAEDSHFPSTQHGFMNAI